MDIRLQRYMNDDVHMLVPICGQIELYGLISSVKRA